jgi:nucleoside-diphosphate-sugar epimerase
MDRNDLMLVTGASGFIGGRLVELLSERGLRVRAAVSNAGNLARISQLNAETVRADLTDHAALSQAVAGCNVVFHVAYRFGGTARQQKINLDGTRILAEAFLKQGGRRFVHVSSMSAYGDPYDGVLTEQTLQRPTREPYSATKQNIERLLLDMHRTRGLPATILQPAIVYGPYGSIWTTPLLEQVRSMRVVLPKGGLGLCNAVYVDDVVNALLLTADCDAAVGETFLISGASPVTWREFYRAYETMVGRTAVIDLDEAQLRLAEGRLGRLRHSAPLGWLLAGVRRLLPGTIKAALKRGFRLLQQPRVDASGAEPPLVIPDGLLHALYASKTHIRIDKARTKLGYSPAFDLDEGMARTAEWARSANLIKS